VRPTRSILERTDVMDWTLEVVTLPVSDIDASVAFYRDQVGFELDHDTTNEFMHVVQLTPEPGRLPGPLRSVRWPGFRRTA
jgi:catechol 2,3-dioxygenase-like lactoylglutathione lyase family enzyme